MEVMRRGPTSRYSHGRRCREHEQEAKKAGRPEVCAAVFAAAGESGCGEDIGARGRDGTANISGIGGAAQGGQMRARRHGRFLAYDQHPVSADSGRNVGCRCAVSSHCVGKDSA